MSVTTSETRFWLTRCWVVLNRWFTFGCAVWWIVATITLLLAIWRPSVRLSGSLAIYLLLTVVASAATFVLYGWDKSAARRGRRRVSERTLQLWALLGGWPGARLAQVLFRHKTQKWSFRVVFWLVVTLHVAIVAYGIWQGWLWTIAGVLFSQGSGSLSTP